MGNSESKDDGSDNNESEGSWLDSVNKSISEVAEKAKAAKEKEEERKKEEKEEETKGESICLKLFNENKEKIKVEVNFKMNDEKEDERNKNMFYELLQNDYFDSDKRETKIVDVSGVKLNMKNNLSSSSIYNCGGNLRIECDIPTSKENFPNYSKVILNVNEVGDSDEVNLIKILTTFMTDKDFLTTYYFDSKLVSENNVPLINLKEHIGDNQKIVNSSASDSNGNLKICWNWNAGRNYNKDRVNGMIDYYMLKLNELIDYIISNDLVIVDSEFSKKFISLFMNSSDILYSYSNGTLLLPSLINWLSSKLNEGKFHALSMCGFIKSGSKVFPVDDEQKKWNEIAKWSDKKDEFTPRISVPRNINNGISEMSKYNYPFYSEYWSVKNVLTDAPEVDFKLNDDLVSSEESKFTEDNYPDSSELIKKVKYAIRNEVGTVDKNVKGKVKATVPIEFNAVSATIDEIYNLKKVNIKYMGLCLETNFPIEGKDCLGKTIYATSEDGNITLAHPSSREYEVYTLKKPNEIKDSLFAQTKYINSRSAGENGYVNPKILGVKNKGIKYNSIVVDGYEYIKGVDVSKTRQGTPRKKTFYLDWDTRCDGDEPKKFEGSVCEEGSSLLSLGYHDIVSPDEITLTAELEIEYETTIKEPVYKGPSGFETTNICDNRLICMCETKYDLYFFNDNVFKYWISLIKNKGNQQFILNNLREYIKNHPGLILMNRINRCIGEYARKFDWPAIFMNNPLGPSLFSIPNSFVVPYKYYYPTFEINNKVDKENVKYDKSKTVNDVVNSVSCENSNNYLDVLFRSVIENSKVLNTKFDKDLVISIVLPSRGSQIFEVISKSSSSLVPSGYVVNVSRVSDKESSLYDFTTSKILLSFRDFSGDEKLATLNSQYKFMTKLNIPLMTISRTNDYFTHLMINTMNELNGTGNSGGSNNLNENVVYIYVSNSSISESVSNVKGVGSEESGGNVDKNKINNIMLNVEYRGVDSNKTPTCLKLQRSPA